MGISAGVSYASALVTRIGFTVSLAGVVAGSPSEVFKLDIDEPRIERELVAQLLSLSSNEHLQS